jgi:phosphatidylserine/phosphatidylglycerophosphate/cardiolipin synthase-like enzyme
MTEPAALTHRAANPRPRQWRRRLAFTLAVAALASAAFFAVPCFQRLPDGLALASAALPAADVQFLADRTVVRADGARVHESTLFDEAFALIAGAERLILADYFLFNAHLGRASSAPGRLLSEELTAALEARAAAAPDLAIVFITDPINDVYGALPSPHLERLRAAGAHVVITQLDALRDSNPLFSIPWRLLARPWGTSPGTMLPNPFGPGRISVRAALRLLNFKANHRKVLIADAGDDWVALVASANPHDGSAAHANVALRFRGPAALAALEAEAAVLAFSGYETPPAMSAALAAPRRLVPVTRHAPTVQLLTEQAIKRSALGLLANVAPGDQVDLALFYLDDRDLVRALRAAHARGAHVRVLLDPNKDAFGLEKNGVPNRPVAHELTRAGVPVRWADTRGEQFHAKSLQILDRNGQHAALLLGSANWTRRNLDNFNLEANALLRSAATHPAQLDASRWFDQLWNGDGPMPPSLDHAAYADASLLRRALYRVQEALGLGTF